MAGYVVIAADGTLQTHPEPPTLERINTAVGPEGWALVPLRHGLSGFVNDCGLLAPETYARNPIGACVLAALGAGQQPYAGPVVITGWNDDPYSDEPEIRPLADLQAAALETLHQKVLAVLAGDLPAGVPEHAVPQLREYAEYVRTGPAPRLESVPVESLEDLRRLLGGDRR